MSIEELQKSSAELGELLNQPLTQRVKNILIAGKAEIDKEIVNLEMKAKLAEERKAGAESVKRYMAELNEYAWDQSDKYVKLFVTLAGVQNVGESNVTMTFVDNCMSLVIRNLNNKDYGLTVNNLLEPIDVEKSYRKVKTDMVAIYLKKQNEGKHWDHLTTVQKRIKDKHDKDFKGETSEGSEDALINIMKKMYNTGDTKTKQMIAKAWTESQEKMHTGGGAPMLPTDI